MTRSPAVPLAPSQQPSEADALLTALVGALLGLVLGAVSLNVAGIGMFGGSTGDVENFVVRATWAGFSCFGALRCYRVRKNRDLIASLAQGVVDLCKGALLFMLVAMLFVVTYCAMK